MVFMGIGDKHCALFVVLDSSCRLSPVEVCQPLAHSSFLWWVLLAVAVCRSIFLSSLLAYDCYELSGLVIFAFSRCCPAK